MAKGNPQSTTAQLQALRRRQLIHLGTALFHDERAGRFLLHGFPHSFHTPFIPLTRKDVNFAPRQTDQVGRRT